MYRGKFCHCKCNTQCNDILYDITWQIGHSVFMLSVVMLIVSMLSVIKL